MKKSAGFMSAVFNPAITATSKRNNMKAFQVTATIKGEKIMASIFAHTSEDALQIARHDMGYEMRGVFFPLHRSEINGVRRVK